MVVKTVVEYFSNLWRGPRKEGGSYWYPIGGSNNTWNEIDLLDSFLTVPELNAIINLKARQFSNGALKIVNKKGKEVEGHHFEAMLRNPNWFQAQKEFMMQTKLFHEIYGNEYMYTLFPVGFKRTDRTKALFTLPPNLVTPEIEGDKPFFEFSKAPKVNYILDVDGRKINLDPETIIHLNDNRVNITKINQKDILKGESKMLALKAPINNIKAAYESRGIIIVNRGAQGIISPDGKDAIGMSIPFEKEEKDAIHAAYRGTYGTMKGQSQVYITNTSTKFSSMTVNDPRKLGLFEECKEDFKKMLDAYGPPSEMFAREDGSTYENQKQAEKGMYIRTTIPEANEWVAGLNQALMQDDKAKIIVDYSHLPCFQEELQHKADSLNSMVTVLSTLLQDGQITNQEYREELLKIGIGDGKAIAPTEPSTQNENEQEE